ncbi:hypothetical protein [uncultured Ligilactobacillus sp.]|uniref:hypothetical protein n=1 Tax=uncultured Ligilactobacillus sp. TaxID=2837633 RepID=UPI00272D49EF|nr:hypothetical protein [uncultured Ligilactobacillus sp.]
MFKIVRSESVKLKGSFQLYFAVGVMVLQLVTVVPYVLLLKNGVALVDVALLTFAVYPLVTSMSAVLLFEQEKMADSFQEIRCYPKKYQLWGIKVVLNDFLSVGALMSTWLILGQIKLALSAFFLIVLLEHIHIGLAFFVDQTKNILFGFLEVLFVIFASNKALLNVYVLPVILPVNYIFRPSSLYLLLYVSYLILATCIVLWGIRRLDQ